MIHQWLAGIWLAQLVPKRPFAAVASAADAFACADETSGALVRVVRY